MISPSDSKVRDIVVINNQLHFKDDRGGYTPLSLPIGGFGEQYHAFLIWDANASSNLRPGGVSIVESFKLLESEISLLKTTHIVTPVDRQLREQIERSNSELIQVKAKLNELSAFLYRMQNKYPGLFDGEKVSNHSDFMDALKREVPNEVA